MATKPPKKRTPVKTAAKKASAPREHTAAKKAPAKKSAASAASKTKAANHDTLQNVARSIGSTLGSLAKKTSDAVKAAKQVLPGTQKQ
jgi:hypothetical protein